MSLLKANSVQIGQSATATNNFTLAVPSSPDGTIKLARGNSGATTADVLAVDGSGNVTANLTASSIPSASITAAKLNGSQTGSAPVYGVRAWCVFNGTTAGTNAPITGGNITSITRNSVGDYTVTFATAMPTSNYCVTVGSSSNGTASGWICFPHVFTATGGTYSAPTTTSFRLTITVFNTTGYVDPSYINIMVVG
jgi:hypothetical protein